MSRRARANPLVVLLSVLLGVDLFGMVGALLAIPVAGAISGILSSVRRHRPLRDDELLVVSDGRPHEQTQAQARVRRQFVILHWLSQHFARGPNRPRGGDQLVTRALPGAADAARWPPRPACHHPAAGMRRNATVALLQDAAPFVLARSWVATVVAAAFGYFWIAAIGLCLGVYHVVLLRRSARPDEVPAWVESAPTLRLAVANVYVDNVEFAASARQLAELDVDVVIVVEMTPRFREAFDAAGGLGRFAHRAFDAADGSDYAVSLYTRLEPESIGMMSIGTLSVATAVIHCGAARLRVMGAIPHAATTSAMPTSGWAGGSSPPSPLRPEGSCRGWARWCGSTTPCSTGGSGRSMHTIWTLLAATTSPSCSRSPSAPHPDNP